MSLTALSRLSNLKRWLERSLNVVEALIASLVDDSSDEPNCSSDSDSIRLEPISCNDIDRHIDSQLNINRTNPSDIPTPPRLVRSPGYYKALDIERMPH